MRVTGDEHLDARCPSEGDEVLVVGVHAYRFGRWVWVVDDDAFTAKEIDIGVDLGFRHIPLELLSPENLGQLGEQLWRRHELERAGSQLDQELGAGTSRAD